MEPHHGWDHYGWWLSPTPLKNDGQLVTWDDDIPNMLTNMMGNIIQMFQTTNQMMFDVFISCVHDKMLVALLEYAWPDILVTDSHLYMFCKRRQGSKAGLSYPKIALTTTFTSIFLPFLLLLQCLTWCIQKNFQTIEVPRFLSILNLGFLLCWVDRSPVTADFGNFSSMDSAEPRKTWDRCQGCHPISC